MSRDSFQSSNPLLKVAYLFFKVKITFLMSREFLLRAQRLERSLDRFYV